mmetsp:Transcript_28029/g.56798  ORF Transcript_28029/g.56798 Transcript_28029/m.56798 type:complete len:252 (-) Transcript_28029:2259-3014(-)
MFIVICSVRPASIGSVSLNVYPSRCLLSSSCTGCLDGSPGLIFHIRCLRLSTTFDMMHDSTDPCGKPHSYSVYTIPLLVIILVFRSYMSSSLNSQYPSSGNPNVCIDASCSSVGTLSKNFSSSSSILTSMPSGNSTASAEAHMSEREWSCFSRFRLRYWYSRYPLQQNGYGSTLFFGSNSSSSASSVSSASGVSSSLADPLLPGNRSTSGSFRLPLLGRTYSLSRMLQLLYPCIRRPLELHQCCFSPITLR